MKLVESMLTKNPCYGTGRKIEVRGVMPHSVGCPQLRASAFINSWNSPGYDAACVHAFIGGMDGVVYQTLPWNHRGWHCGSGGNCRMRLVSQSFIMWRIGGKTAEMNTLIGGFSAVFSCAKFY